MTDLAAMKDCYVVIKIGGNSLDEEPEFLPRIATELAILQQAGLHIVLVHGGGPQIDRALQHANLMPQKAADGRRLTDDATMMIVAQTMTTLTKAILAALEQAKCRATTLPASPVLAETMIKNDRVGKPVRVNTTSIKAVLAAGDIVLLNSVARGEHDGLDYNVNADDYALAVATALPAKRLVLATNVKGVWGADKQPLPLLTPSLAAQLMQEGVIAGGMIPKVQSALGAVAAGVGGVVICDAHQPNALNLALTAPQQVGTLIAQQASE